MRIGIRGLMQRAANRNNSWGYFREVGSSLNAC